MFSCEFCTQKKKKENSRKRFIAVVRLGSKYALASGGYCQEELIVEQKIL